MGTQRIGKEIGMLGNLLKRQMNCTHEHPVAGRITGSQAMVLWYLMHADGDRFQRDVENHFQIRRSTATGMLNLMEEHGLLRREAVAEDRRLKRLVLTEQAETLFGEIQQMLDRTETIMRQGIDAQELATWFAVSAKMRANLEQYQRNASEGEG